MSTIFMSELVDHRISLGITDTPPVAVSDPVVFITKQCGIPTQDGVVESCVLIVSISLIIITVLLKKSPVILHGSTQQVE